MNENNRYSSDYRRNQSQRPVRYQTRDVSGFGPKLSPNIRHEKSRPIDFRQSVRLTDISIELTDNWRTVQSTDPFDSPNPMVKDFRLYDRNAVNSPNAVIYDQMFSSSLDSSKQLETKQNKSVINSSAEEKSYLKPSDDSEELRSLLRGIKEPVTDLGLSYIKRSDSDGFSCVLCKCYRLRPFNTIEHIRGFRHRSALEFIDSRSKRTDRKRKNSDPVESSRLEVVENANPTESKSKSLFSCQKTIENLKTVRNICDQMIGFFSEQKSALNVLSKNSLNALTDSQSDSLKTSSEYLSAKIKKEN